MWKAVEINVWNTKCSANWEYAYSELMKSVGFQQGKSSPCVFWHKEREIRCVVHGDDFNVLGWQSQLDWFQKKIKTKFLSKHRGRLGPGPSDLKRLRILNRIVEWSEKGIYYEGDQRHVEICLKEMGIDASSREVTTPCDKSLEDVKNSNALKGGETRVTSSY